MAGQLIGDYRRRLRQKRREISDLRDELRDCRRNLSSSVSNPVTTSFARETKENVGSGGRRKTKSRKKHGGFQSSMDLTKDFVKNKFDLLVERRTKIEMKVPIWNLTGTGQRREEDVRNIILHKYEDEDGNIIDYKDTDGTIFFYRDLDVHYDYDYEREVIDLDDYNPGEIKINISKPQSGSGRKKRKTRKKKGGITPAEFNFQRFKAERLQKALNKCREKEKELQVREKELQVALASASSGKQLPAELEKNITSFMGGGRDLCEQGYGPHEDEFELLQSTIREGQVPEHLIEPDGHGGIDMLMTINNVANDYCYRLKGRGAYCDQTTAKCKKQIQHRQNGGHHLYKRLGVSKYASQKQIRKAFKTLKKKRKANKKVKEAYKILSNKKTRKQYNNRYRKAMKRGGKRKTRRRKGGNENCYGFRNLEDSKLCNEIHQAAQYYNTSRPDRLSTGQKIARKIKNRTTRRNRPKPETPRQVAQQKQATFLKFKDKLQPVLAKLKENEDNIRADLIETIEGPNDPMGEKQRVLEAEYDEAFSKTNEKLMLMKEINANLSSDKSPLPAQIEKARNDYSNRGKVPLAPNHNYSNFNVAY